MIKLRVYVTTCIVLYIVYPKMIEQLLGSLHCFKALADGPGDVIIHRLRNHPEILCSDKNYKWFKSTLPHLNSVEIYNADHYAATIKN